MMAALITALRAGVPKNVFGKQAARLRD